MKHTSSLYALFKTFLVKHLWISLW